MRDDPFVTSRAVPTPAASAAIVQSSDDAIIGLTLDGIVTSWNPAAERIYGYNATEMIGYKLLRLVPDELRSVEQGRLEKVAQGASQRVNDMPRLRKDGARLVVSSSMFAVRDDRQRVSSIALIEHDATRRRALEAQLLQAKRVEAVGRLAGGVAQEFNNISTAILGLVEFITDRVKHDTAAATDLEEITRQAMRASRLSQHLLAFGGRRAPVQGIVDVRAALRSMEPLLQRLVGEGVWLTLDLDDGGTITGDEAQLELVLFELVMTASDSIGDRGAITIATRRTTVDDTALPAPAGVPSGSYIEIAVRDSGRSASPARRPEESGALDELGTEDGALAMALVYSIVERLGGYIATTPVPPDGVETSLFLPVTAPEATPATPAAPAAAPARGGTETILLVEDEDGVRAVVARSLRSQGYRVLEARHGEDALDVAQAHKAPIHLVVSDVVMPHMDGGALFLRLRGWYPQLRFLFVSGYTRGAIAAEHLRGPTTDFLAKPFTLDQLLTAVRGLLERPTTQPTSGGDA